MARRDPHPQCEGPDREAAAERGSPPRHRARRAWRFPPRPRARSRPTRGRCAAGGPTARARGHAREGQAVRGGRVGDDRHRAVAASHPEGVRAAVDGVCHERREVLPGLEDDRVDAELSRALGQSQPDRGVAARPRVDEEHGPVRPGTGRQLSASRNRSAGLVLCPCMAASSRRSGRPRMAQGPSPATPPRGDGDRREGGARHGACDHVTRVVHARVHP